jgi:hypothetical protein
MASLLFSIIVPSVMSFLLLYYVFRKGKKVRGPLPPGPPADPFIGHVRLIPAENPEFTYMKWGKDYSLSILSRLSSL